VTVQAVSAPVVAAALPVAALTVLAPQYTALVPVAAPVRVPSLPAYLAPSRGADAPARERESLALTTATVTGTIENLSLLEGTLTPQAGALQATVAACRETIRLAASTYGAARVEAASAGVASPDGRGGTDVPIQARVLYSSQGETEVREARITCSLDELGRVMALK
jgi:hypothetical protein